MPRVLIINHCLRIGGGEKLVHELAVFAKKNNIQPYVLIVDNYEKEYFDDLFRQMKIPLIRTRVTMIFKLRHPVRLATALFWRLRLKYLSNRFNTIHIINPILAHKVRPFINHKKVFIWNVANSVQYPDHKMPFEAKLFENEEDTIISINEYQDKEIENQFGPIRMKKILFKLFLN